MIAMTIQVVTRMYIAGLEDERTVRNKLAKKALTNSYTKCTS